jgi:radical SAM superfamily enzyme YgiQ (UPF0313 family)
MRYEGDIYRPPSEARSLLVQVTIGCSHNRCTFCSMFKEKKFRVRDVGEVIEDLESARKTYRAIDRIFLCDGDALCLSADKLLVIFDRIADLFPECSRVSLYGSPKDVLRKKPAELRALKDAGLGIIYIGAESGSDRILTDIHKGVSRAEIIEAVQKIESAGIEASVTFISGLGGRPLWEEHAVDTGTMISEMSPTYAGLLTLMLEPGAPLREDVMAGSFELLSPEEVVAETLLMMKHIDVSKKCIFRSNHASNYISLRGTLPADKDRMMDELRLAMKNTGLLKDERFRML